MSDNRNDRAHATASSVVKQVGHNRITSGLILFSGLRDFFLESDEI